MNSRSLDILDQYIAGEIDLESAAELISKLGEFSLTMSPNALSSAGRERVEELFGRVLWLLMREQDPSNVPERPFGAAEFRAFKDDTFFDAPSDAPDDKDNPDLAGAS